MTQETRRDRRVRIVSLNVRYKSATVDEFIENHAYDVSRGGIYIKTSTPFQPGTLLKFEIRLASDQPVIAGVGRVVWKRDAKQSMSDLPAGMGVKFIKIDEPSRMVIDRLANSRADAGKAFEAEAEGTGASEPPPSVSMRAADSEGARRTSTKQGMGVASASKATMAGLGAVSTPSPPGVRHGEGTPSPPGLPTASPPPRPDRTSVRMFPSADTIEDAPPKQEQTVMRQAAELLEEALREAGGSMDEIGTNPLFSAGGGRPKSNERPSANRAKAAQDVAGGDGTTPAPGRGLHREAASSPAPEPGRDGTVAESVPPAVVSSKPRMYPPGGSTSGKVPSIPKVVLEQEPTSPGMRQALRARVARASDVQTGKKKRPVLLVAVAALAAVGVAVLMFGKSFFGETTSDAPRAPSPSGQSEPARSSMSPAIPPGPMVASPLSEDAHAAPASAGSESPPTGSAVVPATTSAPTAQPPPLSPAVTNPTPRPVAAAAPAPAKPPTPPATPARPPTPPPPPATPAPPPKPRGAAPAPSEDTDNPY